MRLLVLAILLASACAGSAQPPARQRESMIEDHRQPCDLQAATKEKPCQLREALGFDELARVERRMMARMENAEASEHNINVGDQMFESYRNMIQIQRRHFSEMCGLWRDLDADLIAFAFKSGTAPDGLTSDALYRWVGQPDDEGQTPKVKSWMWTLKTHLSGLYAAGINFMRTPTGSWRFIGCQWCENSTCMPAPFVP